MTGETLTPWRRLVWRWRRDFYAHQVYLKDKKNLDRLNAQRAQNRGR